VVLDLEDSVPVERKQAARAALSDAVRALDAAVATCVRVNPEQDLLQRDLLACADAGVGAILLPKVGGPTDLERLYGLLEKLDYHPRVNLLIESCQGVTALPRILDAAGPLETVALGVEDLRQELELFAPGGRISPSLEWAHSALVFAAQGAGVRPLGLLGSIAELSDLDEFASGARTAWRMGFRGSYCVHPRQVPILNTAYGPDERDLSWAGSVTAAAAEHAAAGRGSFTVDGRMVDAPLVARAERILALVTPLPVA
jgi:citrate lyase subunit beta/citryl-CoA lyase